jgi:hypothetical protein
MRNWKAIAEARGIDIPAENLERTIAPLEEMEEIFRSLVSDLTPESEPAFEVHLEAGE